MNMISIIFSFKNEENNIPEIIRRIDGIFSKLDKWKYELVFVNDGSTDSSEKILTDNQKKVSDKNN